MTGLVTGLGKRGAAGCGGAAGLERALVALGCLVDAEDLTGGGRALGGQPWGCDRLWMCVLKRRRNLK